MSLARRHFQETSAKRAAEVSSEKGGQKVEGDIATQILALLRSHEILLKGIRSTRSKIMKKREFLPDYAAYVDGVIASDTGLQDDVLPTIMVWRLDCGDLSGALIIAEYVLRHELAMPERFRRDPATLLLEEIAEFVERIGPDGEQAKTFIDALEEAMLITDDHDINDEVRAKAHKQMGALLEKTDPAAALIHLKQALDFDPKCGVKTRLGSLEKKLAAEDENAAGGKKD